jgi:hypothetical protein
LSVDEPAWKLQMTLARDDPAAFLPEEQLTFGSIPLPATDSSRELNDKGTVQGVDLRLTAIGRGAVKYSDLETPGQYTTHHSSSRNWGERPYNVSHSTSSSSGGSTTSTIAITGDLVHLVLKLANLPPNHRNLLRVHDDQGRELPHRLDRWTGMDAAKYFLFVDPPADAQSLRLTVYVHTARTVEFLIAPPRP